MKRLRYLWQFLFVLIFVQVAFIGEANGQSTEHTLYASSELEKKGAVISLEHLLEEIEREYNVTFLYEENVVADKYLSSGQLSLPQTSKGQGLAQILTALNIDYWQLDEETYVLAEKKSSLISGSLFQQETITGTVTDARDGTSLPGVNVIVKGTTTGASTDSEGNYELDAPSLQDTLIFSFVGYQSQEVPINGRTEISVALQSQAIAGEELVVVGYGTQRREDVISGISTVSTEQLGLEDQFTPNAADLMKGRMAGVNIREGTGAAGATPVIQVRGISSINAGVEPLVIVDGFPVGNSFPQSLNVDEITNITVLKDAASTAIYGARGSNGVVLIETKNARVGQSELSYNTYVGTHQIPKSWRPQMMNALEYAQFNKERIEDLDDFNNATTPTPIPQVFLDVLDNPEQWRDGGTDWFDEFLRDGADAISQNHNLTYRYGNDRIRSVISGGFLGQTGIIPGDEFQRLTLRTKFEASISEKINMGVNLSGSRVEDDRVNTDGARSALWAAVVGSPLQSPYDENGNPTKHMPGDAPGYFAMPNPLHSLNVIDNVLSSRDLQANIDFDVEITEGLHFAPRFYGRQLINKTDYFRPTTVGNVAIAGGGNLDAGSPPQPNSKNIVNFNLENWGIDNVLKYNRSIENHNIDITIGHTMQMEEASTNEISGADFPSDEIVNLAEAGEISSTSSHYGWSLIAGFGRITYDYQGKYLAEANYRREGSSRLGANNRYGNFPSGSIGWRISEENFYPQEFLFNEILIRASYGKTGNNAIGNYDALGRLSSIRTVLGDEVRQGKFASSMSNQNLRWETALQYQLGVTLGLLDDRINLKMDYYKKTTEDMLFNVPTPRASGFASSRINIGEMENKGIDIEVNSNNMVQDNFQWSSNFNVSFMSNVVTRMPEQVDEIIAGPIRGTNLTKAGEEIGAFYGFVRLGIFDEETINDPNLYGWQGDEKILGTNIFKDLNGDGFIDYEDRTVIGSPHPDVTFGFNNRFVFKNFSFSMLLTGMLGYDIMQASRGVYYNNAARWNVSKELLDRWKSPENPGSGQVPRTEYNVGNRESMDDWLEPGDHLWIKNINLSYSLSENITQSLGGINDLRIYFSIKNLARFDNYIGFNPEVSQFGNDPLVVGIDNFVYPISRSYTIGIDINF